ncbi:phospholipid transport system substrate-binding protein [Desulfocicer vacuolatum DSM 3385]|uniref:Phospholipid transport system substrate-binding protein n=1 Tax=Desulfocicer vacuolatum DSM 3385 TaxID=1121400 RepID=A0A1W2CBA7_9BACT|nr:ABC transporter substrate-binding protein [Desulfocicer vacuolatum]SMC82557.1 phospholipid transport system substrate-binding protein [Desulfocicer vacuolatum DSM 3385]
MKYFTMICLGILLIMPMADKIVHGATAVETMSKITNEVLNVLKDPGLKDEAFLVTKKEKLWEIMDHVFDYQLLSQYSLGRKWRRITPEQQADFIRVYGLLLGKTYMNRILSYGDEKIIIGREIPLADGIAEVQTTLVSQKNDIPIHYRMSLANGEWKIFDVVIEGVSLTKNYRSQFKKYLSGKSMAQLLKVLDKKTRGARPEKSK